jgi:excisionase family DNA binding protein
MADNGAFENQLLTVSEIASALKVPVSWVYERTRRSGGDRIPHIKLGKYVRFRWPTVQKWLETLHRN